MSLDSGFVVLYRKIMDSTLWSLSGNDYKLANACLFLANWKENKWFDRFEKKEIIIKRGQFITSLAHLAAQARLSIKETRNGLRRLEEINFIEKRAQERARQFSLISIVNYNTYQDLNNEPGIESGTGRAQAGHRPGTGRAQAGQQLNKDNKDNQGTKEQSNHNSNTLAPASPEPLPQAKVKSDFTLWQEWFCNEFLDRVGEKYSWQEAKDTVASKSLLGSLGLETCKKRAENMFNTSDDFILKMGFSIGTLSNQRNKLAVEPSILSPITVKNMRNFKIVEDMINAKKKKEEEEKNGN